MKLNQYIAQSIVNRTMELIAHNVNIMDHRGVIIGSGDQSRLGNIHQGAKLVLERKTAVEVEKGNPEGLQGAREGVNLPVCFQGETIGVVGITGDPEEVRVYGKMVQAMAELMLEEAFYWQQVGLEEQARFALVNDLIRREPGHDIAGLVTRADLLGYDLTLPRVVIVFFSREVLPDNRNSMESKQRAKDLMKQLGLEHQDLFAAGIGGRFVLLRLVGDENNAGAEKRAVAVLEKLRDQEVTAGVGPVCRGPEDIAGSYNQALQALEIGMRLSGPGRVYFATELGLEKFICQVGEEFRRSFYEEVLGGLLSEDKKHKQLLETAATLLDCDLKPGLAARRLYIHRNTLTYRTGRIKAITGMDLEKLEDALKFKLALLCCRLEGKVVPGNKMKPNPGGKEEQ